MPGVVSGDFWCLNTGWQRRAATVFCMSSMNWFLWFFSWQPNSSLPGRVLQRKPGQWMASVVSVDKISAGDSQKVLSVIGCFFHNFSSEYSTWLVRYRMPHTWLAYILSFMVQSSCCEWSVCSGDKKLYIQWLLKCTLFHLTFDLWWRKLWNIITPYSQEITKESSGWQQILFTYIKIKTNRPKTNTQKTNTLMILPEWSNLPLKHFSGSLYLF